MCYNAVINLIEVNFMDQNTLNEILRKHKLWLDGEPGKEYADLHGINLYYSDLCNTCLQFSNLRDVILSCAKLYKCKLEYASLVDADLQCADLQFANLLRANLQSANLQNSKLCYANLVNANLCGADLRGSDLYNACVYGANFTDVIVDETTKWFNLHCPAEGSYIGYKKCRGGLIVELEIPADAKRSSATTEKCRASKAKVISITNLDGTPVNVEDVMNCGISYYNFYIYRIGETVEVLDFDENRWNECSTGIHHFMTRQEAVDYKF